MSKLVLILIAGAFLTYGVANLWLNDNVTRGTENATDNYSLTKARNIANSTAEIIFSNLGDNINWRKSPPKTISFMGGQAIYLVEDAFFNGDSLIKISVMGIYGNASKSITVYTLKELKSPRFPPPLKGAITSNNVTQVAGNIIIDGREHTSDAILIPNTGTWGIWTTETFNLKGAGTVGGTYYIAGSGIDIAPTKKPEHLLVVAQNQTWSGGFPQTPEDVFGGEENGYPKDILLKIAKSGIHGSQYVTDGTKLKLPLSGITYVELPSGGIWQPFNVEGSGILIVHNKNVNAAIKNINKGTFRGFLIADDIVNINNLIIGAVVSLTKNPSLGHIIGSGNGIVLFSRQTVNEATEYLINHVYSYRGKRVNIKYWFE